MYRILNFNWRQNHLLDCTPFFRLLSNLFGNIKYVLNLDEAECEFVEATQRHRKIDTDPKAMFEYAAFVYL